MAEVATDEISGYDLAVYLLAKGGVNALLKYARDEESDWLELKRAMDLSAEDRSKGEETRDLYSKYAQAMIALANTAGGALVIGICDKTLMLEPLSKHDPHRKIAKGGLDDYIRQFVRPSLWPDAVRWTDRKRIWELSNKAIASNQFSWEHYPYRDPSGVVGEVIVVLVRPFESPRITKVDNKYSSLLKRRDGDLGEVEPFEFDIEKINGYLSSRKATSPRYAAIRDRFDTDCKKNDSRTVLNEAIRAYYARFEARLEERAKCRMDAFTPLDARESVFADESANSSFSPRAVELVDDDEIWLKSRNEGETAAVTSGGDLEESEVGDDEYDVASSRPARQGDLLSILDNENRVIISGEPGGGKTTCLQYYALQFGKCADVENPVLALFIPMGQWGCVCSIEHMMAEVSRLKPGQLTQLVAENRLRLIIDAVNECPDKYQDGAIQNIGIYLHAHPGLPAVLSTRHPEKLAGIGFPVFRVQPMDEGHQRRYLERYLGDKDQAEELMKQVLSMPGGETIAENPMLLRLVVKVYRESSDHRLPSGRAGLYRKSLRSWYQREKGKFEKAGGGMSWDEKQTLRLLSELAFRGRMKGYRDIPIEIVGEFWGEQVAERIGTLCQGPVVYQEDEFVKFRHETYQEYLCAEFLIAHPDELPEWGLEDYPRWGMVFAYVVELFDSDMHGLPQSFWLAAWKLDPWMGAALTSAATWTQLVRPNFKGTRPMVNGKPLGVRKEGKIQGAPYSFAVSEYVPSCKALRWSLCNRKNTWYHRNNVALRYVVLIDRERTKHWRRFELAQVPQIRGLGLRYAISLAKSWLVIDDPRECFRNSVVDEWNSWVSQANVEDAERLIDCHIALSADFSIAKARWMTGMTLQLAMDLLKKQLLSQDDVRNEIPRWISSATVKEAIDMVSIGVAMIGDFDQRLKEWMESATPKDAFDLVSADFLKQEAFAPIVSRWLEKVTPQSAKWLIKGGWTTQEELNAKMPAWMRDRQGLLM